MANEAIKKVLANVAQNLTNEEKQQARNNIGAAAAADVVTDAVRYSEQNPTAAEQAQARENIDAAKNALASSSNSGLMSSEDKTKLDGIQSGAEANVQSDWNQTNSNADDYIKNKPSMVGKVHFLKAVGDELADVRAPYGFWIVDLEKPNPQSPYGYDYAMSTEIMAKLSAGEVFVLSTYSTAPSPEEDLFIMDRAQNQSRDGHPAVRIWFTRMFASGSPEYMYFTTIYTPSMYNENPNTDEPEGRMAILNWRGDQSALSEFRFMPYKELATVATTGDYNDLVNKPNIPAAQIQSDWNQSDNTQVDFIKNKPANLVQDASYVHTDNNFSNSDKNKLDGIASGAEVNVQPDWNQSDSTKDDYIKNKPSIPAAQIQSDWTQSDNTKLDYIKNKPQIGFKSYGSQSVTEATSLVVDGDEPHGVTDIKVNGGSKGVLISGPYKTLLDSGILGALGDINNGIFIDSNGEFKACSNPVFFKVTLTTTFAELEAAIAANKIPLLVTASKVVPMCRYATGATAWFTDVTMWGNLLSVGAHSYVLSPSGWSEYPESLNENEDIHMPSCITAKVTTTLQDNYDEWIRIGEFAIGGHGTSGGSIMIGIKRVLSGAVNCVTDSVFRTKNANASGVLDNVFETDAINVPSTGWVLLRMIDQYSGTATVDCTYDISIFETTSTNPSHHSIKIHKLFDGTNSRLYISATESWGSLD